MQRTPRLFEFFVAGEVVRLEELAESLQLTGNSLRQHVSNLIQGRHLQPIRPGLYVVGTSEDLSPFVLGSHIVPDGRLAMASALAFYAGRRLGKGAKVHILTRQSFRHFSFMGIDYQCCLPWHAELAEQCALSPRQLHSEQRHPQWGPSPIRLCSPALALVQCLGRPVHCRSLTDLFELCAALPAAPDVSVMLTLARALKRHALAARLGLVLDLFNPSWQVAPEVRRELLELRPQKTAPWVVDMSPNCLVRWQRLPEALFTWRIELRQPPI